MAEFTPFEQWMQKTARSGKLPDTIVFRLDGTMIVGELSEAEMHQVLVAIPLGDQQRAAKDGALVVYNTKKKAVRLLAASSQ